LRDLFEWKTVRELAAHLERASKSEAELGGPLLQPVARTADLPLSYAQQRLWFLDQLEFGTSYNISAAISLRGELDVGALEQTLSEIIRRHEVLRTSFAEVNGQPVQVIYPAVAFKLFRRDLSHYGAADRELEVIRLAREEARQTFDLSSGQPMLRARLLKLEAAEHVLLFTMHHIVSDGWSVGVLLREVATLYKAYSRGGFSPLPELPIQYADFAVWQREWLTGEVLDRQLEYWKEQLQGMTQVLDLPTDKMRPAVQTFRGEHESFPLTLELSEKLKELSRNEDVTLFMTLLAAWQVLLHRYTNRKQISVGTPIANRNRAETEQLIGFFVNTLVMNTDLSGDPTFRELLKRVREVCLGAYAHQDVPFEKLVEILQPERSLSHTPLIQTWFVLQNAPESKLELAGLSLQPLKLENGTAKFDLGLNMTDTDQGLIGTMEYKTDLFSSTTAKRIVRQFEALVQYVSSHPDAQLSALIDVLVKADKQNQREELELSKKVNLEMLKGIRKRSLNAPV